MGSGLIVKIQNLESNGLIPYKRLLRSIKTPNVNLSNLLQTKYKQSTTHKCRLIDFNCMHNLFICTTEPDILKEKYFTYDDFNVGQTVNGKIKKIIDAGIVIRIGALDGFVPNLHISNVHYTDNIKKKYRVNQNVNLKVLENEENLLLTMKQSLLDSDNCLCDLEEIDEKERYPGVVKRTSKKEVTLLFYNRIVGYLRRRDITHNDNDNIEKMYYIGQVVRI